MTHFSYVILNRPVYKFGVWGSVVVKALRY